MNASVHRRRPSTLYAAFDAFINYPAKGMRNMGFTKQHPLYMAHTLMYSKKTSYERTIWKELMVSPVYSGAVDPRPGDIVDTAPKFFGQLPKPMPIEIWSIDSAKSHSQFIKQSASVWPHLRVGTIIHLMDCAKHQMGFFFSQFVVTGDVSIAFAAEMSAPWSFIVKRVPLDWQRVLEYNEAKFNSTLKDKLVQFTRAQAASAMMSPERTERFVMHVSKRLRSWQA